MSATGPVGNKVFAPAIFFIAFREALEASLVIGILSGMLESLVLHKTKDSPTSTQESDVAGDELREQESRALIRRLRKLVILGALAGLAVAFAIGAAFLAVFYTQANDLYGKAEELWEGCFCLIAVLLITPMSLAILRADKSRAKWQRKLRYAFTPQQPEQGAAAAEAPSSDAAHSPTLEKSNSGGSPTEEKGRDAATLPTLATSAPAPAKRSLMTRARELVSPLAHGRRGAAAIFFIPFVTTLREGLEGVVFIGGVSLGLPASSIPLPAIVGIAVGLLCGWLIFRAGTVGKHVRIFLLASTCALLLIASGMASRAVYYLQFYRYIQLVGGSAAESGDGPGSYYHAGYVWHLDCCNPETNSGGSGWSILNALVGWNNTATIGSVLAYVFYWLAIVAYLGYAAWKEGRLGKAVRRIRGAPRAASRA